MKPALLISILAGTGCATVHSGEYAIPLDARGGYQGPTTAAGLLISGREITRVATPSVGAVEVTFENRSGDWIRVEEVRLDFHNEAANQLVTTPPDTDARAWAQAVSQRDAIELVNRQKALAGVAVAGRVVASIGHRSPVGALGAVVALGALIGLAATSIDADVQNAERVSFLPQDHLLVVPFALPPGLFVKKWIALTTAAPQIPCLDSFVLSYAISDGRHERVFLHFRSLDGASSWQSRACRQR